MGTRSRPLVRRVDVRVIDCEIDTAAAFVSLYGEAQYAFWLDSSRTDSARARFSFMGEANGPSSEILRYRVGSGTVSVEGHDVEKSLPGSIFDVLPQRLAAHHSTCADVPFEFVGGYVGYFGYELKADCGSSNTHTASHPDAMWMFIDRCMVVDHHAKKTYAVALSDGEETRRAAEAWVTSMVRRLDDVGRAGTRALDATDGEVLQSLLVRDRSTYLADIDECLRLLEAGESFEICLTNSVHLPPPSDPLDFYLRLRTVSPASHAAFLRFGDLTIASASPERFLRVGADRIVEARPIKGTSGRSVDPVEDERLREILGTSAKTRAENLMIVDLLRNDLGSVCEVGSVEVPEFMQVESYATMHQLVSTIRGRLRPDVDALGCVRACFPGGSMTGAPKLRTMEILDRIEGRARGIYSGALGYFSASGSADLSVVIRTAVIDANVMSVGAGGAIVLDSQPEAEFDEMVLKAAVALKAYRGPAAPVVVDGLRQA
jgi:para-aminobenzoate synthetase